MQNNFTNLKLILLDAFFICSHSYYILGKYLDNGLGEMLFQHIIYKIAKKQERPSYYDIYVLIIIYTNIFPSKISTYISHVQ